MDNAPTQGKIEPALSTWITHKQPQTWGRFHSTRERRIVTLSSGAPVLVLPVGPVRIPFIRDYDALALVSMAPKQIEVTIAENIVTQDSLPIGCRISIQATIKDNPASIKRIVLDPMAEVRLLKDVLTVSVQDAVLSAAWHEIVAAGDNLVDMIKCGFATSFDEADVCFDVKGLVLSEIRPLDENLAQAYENAVREKASGTLQIELAELQHKRALIERHAEKDAAEDRLEIQNVNLRSELEIERHKLQLEQENEDAQIKRQAKLAKLLHEDGRVATLLNDTLYLLMQKIDVFVTDSEAKTDIYRELERRSEILADLGIDAVRVFLENDIESGPLGDDQECHRTD